MPFWQDWLCFAGPSTPAATAILAGLAALLKNPALMKNP
jgi:hypothetical protein